MHVTSGKAFRKSGDSLRLPGAETNGEITLPTPIAENDDLVTLHFFVTTEPDVVAAFLRGCRRSIGHE